MVPIGLCSSGEYASSPLRFGSSARRPGPHPATGSHAPHDDQAAPAGPVSRGPASAHGRTAPSRGGVASNLLPAIDQMADGNHCPPPDEAQLAADSFFARLPFNRCRRERRPPHEARSTPGPPRVSTPGIWPIAELALQAATAQPSRCSTETSEREPVDVGLPESVRSAGGIRGPEPRTRTDRPGQAHRAPPLASWVAEVGRRPSLRRSGRGRPRTRRRAP